MLSMLSSMQAISSSVATYHAYYNNIILAPRPWPLTYDPDICTATVPIFGKLWQLWHLQSSLLKLYGYKKSHENLKHSEGQGIARVTWRFMELPLWSTVRHFNIKKLHWHCVKFVTDRRKKNQGSGEIRVGRFSGNPTFFFGLALQTWEMLLPTKADQVVHQVNYIDIVSSS